MRRQKRFADERLRSLYDRYHGMLQRCYNPKDKGYRRYGGRGIAVCTDWKNCFERFRKWAESSGFEKGLSLDRIDNNGMYSPSNCRWATRKEQQRNVECNRWVDLCGSRVLLTDVCDSLKIARCKVLVDEKDGHSALESIVLTLLNRALKETRGMTFRTARSPRTRISGEAP